MTKRVPKPKVQSDKYPCTLHARFVFCFIFHHMWQCNSSETHFCCVRIAQEEHPEPTPGSLSREITDLRY